jgi:hypothetical protein
MSEQDQHITDALGRAGPTEIAVSVYTGDENWEAFCYDVNGKIRQLRRLRDSELIFFDAQSRGCWIH